MTKILCAMMLLLGCARAQVAAPAADSATRLPASDDASAPRIAATTDRPAAELVPGGKVGLVRGVVKRVDPIHDQLFIHTFGGGDIRIAFDPRTRLVSDTQMRLTSLTAGSVVSVDTVINDGKLFARSVRTGSPRSVELNGQVVGYDPAKSRLTVRDPISPDSVSLRITANTTVVKQGVAVAPQSLSPGTLVRVWFSPREQAANNVEVLAERGESFTFEGRIVAIDLRSGILALSNDSDQSIRELAIGSLNAAGRDLLREGTEVSVQAEFDGDRYNVRDVMIAARNP